jgi:hypothetical protein
MQRNSKLSTIAELRLSDHFLRLNSRLASLGGYQNSVRNVFIPVYFMSLANSRRIHEGPLKPRTGHSITERNQAGKALSGHFPRNAPPREKKGEINHPPRTHTHTRHPHHRSSFFRWSLVHIFLATVLEKEFRFKSVHFLANRAALCKTSLAARGLTQHRGARRAEHDCVGVRKDRRAEGKHKHNKHTPKTQQEQQEGMKYMFGKSSECRHSVCTDTCMNRYNRKK